MVRILMLVVFVASVSGCGGGKPIKPDSRETRAVVEKEKTQPRAKASTFSDMVLREVALNALQTKLPNMIGDDNAKDAQLVAVEVKRFGTAKYEVYGRIQCKDQYGDERDSKWKVIIVHMDDDDLFVSSMQLDVKD